MSRYRRFLAPIDHLSDQQLAYLTQVDHIAHEALLAIDTATGEDVAVARFIRDPEDPSRAEVAIVVFDRWQGRGVGRTLADRLARPSPLRRHRVVLRTDAHRQPRRPQAPRSGR